MVLDNFIHKSVSSGLGSPQVEIMADTAVALASANVQLVAKKVIGRLCRVMDKTCLSPTQYLEQHVRNCLHIFMGHKLINFHILFFLDA